MSSSGQASSSGSHYDLQRPSGVELTDGLWTFSAMHVARVLWCADSGALDTASAAWGAASRRLGDLAGVLRAKAVEADRAWSGTGASAAFQRDLKRLHDSVSALADVTSGMARMVDAASMALAQVSAKFPFDDVIGANKLVDHIANVYLRVLTNEYNAAMQTYGPTDFTVEHPKVTLADDTPGFDPLEPDVTGSGENALDGFRGGGALLDPNGLPHGASLPPLSSPVPSDGVLGALPPEGDSGGPLDHSLPGVGDFPSSVSDRATDGSGLGADGPVLTGPSYGDGAVDGYDTSDTATSLASYPPDSAGTTAFGAGAGGGVASDPFFGAPGGSFGSGGVGEAPVLGANKAGLGGPGSGMGMMPPGMGGTGDEEEERMPESWLPEDLDVWGAKDVEASPPVLGADESERPRRGRRRRDVPDA